MPDTGTLYILSNVDGSLAKVGFTRNGTPDARADAYSAAHGIRWHVYWSALTENVEQVEAAAHRALQDRRFSLTPEAREIFHCTPAHAVRIAERFVVPVTGSTAEQPRPLRFVRRTPWLRHAEIAVAAATIVWPALRQLQRLLRAAGKL
jgi:T5orf172 domain